MADLDSLLDEVLEEFDADEEEQQQTQQNQQQQQQLQNTNNPEADLMQEKIQSLLDELVGSDESKTEEADVDLAKLQEFFAALSGDIEGQPTTPGNVPTNFEESIQTAVDMFAEGGAQTPEEGFNDQFLEKLLGDLENLDVNDDNSLDDMLENMMSEMMCKDSLYPPIEKLVSLYPDWIKENESRLSNEDINIYSRQLDGFRDVLELLNQEPDNSKALSENVIARLGQVQEFGNPPEEILSQLMPEVGEDGECTIL